MAASGTSFFLSRSGLFNSFHMIKNSPLLAWFRKHLRVPVTSLLMACFTLWTVQVQGATLIFDSDGNPGNGATEGSGSWVPGSTVFFNPLSPALNVASTNDLVTDLAQFGNGG